MEAIVSNLVGGFLANLGSEAVNALLQGMKQFKRVQKQVQELKIALRTINKVLLDAEERQANNEQVKVWLQELRNVMYEADDSLDDFFTTVRQSSIISENNLKAQVRVFFSKNNRLLYDANMGRKLEDINQKLDKELVKSRQFHLEEKSQTETGRTKPTHSAMPIIFVGRERDEEEIINLLLQSINKNKVSSIAIVGHGGMGKTTLVRKVYNDYKVERSFELKMWAQVSTDFHVQGIIKKILESAKDEKVKRLEMNTLVNQLKSKIDGKKFLLILDDLWNEDRRRWCELEDLLIGGAQGSKILITTRTKTVADAVGATSVHTLEGLSEEESWSLLQKVAFDEGDELRHQNLIPIGKRIAAKCYGVPLVIVTMGSMLYREYSERNWQKLEEDEISGIDQGKDGVMSTLRVSYNNLPSHLKNCFAYCALFPKGCWIDVITLVQLWMARGLVQLSDKKCCLIKDGIDCFMELFRRCFFQEEELNEWGELWKCKMHDLMHDLATSVAGDECKIFNLATNDIAEGVRHASVDYELDSAWKVPTQLAKARHLRTFFLPSHSRWSSCAPGEAILKDVCSEFKCIRVLDLHNMAIRSVSHSINSLKHLRYLDLSYNKDIKFLPKSLTMLVNLQTLKLNWCEQLQYLPKHFKQLVNLRHLEIEGCFKLVCMPSGLGQLLFLEILSRFVVCKDQKRTDYSCLSELNKLNNLAGMLRIERLGHCKQDKLDFEAAKLEEKRALQMLVLRWNHSDCSEQDEVYDEKMVKSLSFLSNLKVLRLESYADVKFPNWMMRDMASCFPHLVELELNKCRCRQLPLMELLPQLKSLKLKFLREVEYIDEGTNVRSRNASFFPYLEELILFNLPKLKGWWREEVTDQSMPFFPRLSYLHIINCKNLISIPPQPHLNKLEMENANVEMLEKELTITKIWTTETERSPSSSTAPNFGAPLSNLEELRICDIEDEALPKECFENLTSLKQLRIWHFWKQKSIPDLRTLNSLNSLSIWKCPNLKSLPDLPSSLQRLHILDCPKLEERVRKFKGEDWPKISRIPYIRFDQRIIQDLTN